MAPTTDQQTITPPINTHAPHLAASRQRFFPSFFWGGFECSTFVNAEGRRLDLVAATQHDRFAREDYALCQQAGLHVVREVQTALERGVDVQGICLYPVVAFPDWEDPTAFFDGGLFDLLPDAEGRLRRVVSVPTLGALREARAQLDPERLAGVAELLEQAAPPVPGGQPTPLRPLEQAQFKAHKFNYQVLHTGQSLQVELYAFEPGQSFPPHRHDATEHVLSVVTGTARARVGDDWVTLAQGESLLVPAGAYHELHNPGHERLVVQQVSSPRPWDARYAGPCPPTNQPPAG